jgi:diguanylate cyclase (GGDEF)-like protein/PAS domain S-box-containing protein
MMPLQPSTNPQGPSPGRPGLDGGRLADAAIGVVLAALGGSVAAGWLLRVVPLVQLFPGAAPMVLNTAICFVLSGAWLALAALKPERRGAARALAGVVLVFAAAVSLQYAFGADFGIDAPDLHSWLPSSTAFPGRMSAFTGLAFIAAGLAMLLASARAHPRRDGLALVFATTTGAIGALALLGYLFELHLVYARYALGLVASRTAAGLIALSVALWLRLLREQRVHFWQRLAVQERITFASVTILTLTSLAVAVIVFAALEARVTQTLSEGLSVTLRYRVLLAEGAIEGGLQRSRVLVGRPAPARLLRKWRDHPGDAEALAQLRQSVESLLSDGYISGTYFDVQGREIVSAGQALEHPALSVPLRGAIGATLAWKDRFVVSGRYPISDAGGEVGAALVQGPLPALDALVADSYRLGESGEVGMCARVDERLGCFPQARIPNVYFVSTRSSDGEPLPMTRGLSGETGVVLTRDYRGENVMAAYAPFGKFGLAMAAKMDTAEIYAPIRERMQFLLPVLALLVAGGTLLLRMGVRPLAARLAESEREALEQHRALEAMMANVADGMMVLDADGTIRSWNAAAERLFGYSAAEVVGRNLAMLVPEELRAANIAATRRFVKTGKSAVVERANLNYPALRKDGSRFELEGTVTGMGTGAAQLVAVFRDITERKAAEKRLTQLALHDALTGLPNRASFEQRVEEALPRRRHGAGHLALMIMDLDRFKSINDSLGHAAGDQLLIAFAKRLHGTLRENDLVARLGGDEFTIVAENLADARDAVAIAEKVLAAMREPFTIENLALVVTTSIGVAIYREGDTAKTLMKRADTALYEAKGAGRARYQLAQ